MQATLKTLCLVASLMFVGQSGLWAYDAQIGNIYYRFSGDDAIVTYASDYANSNYYYYSGDIVIPSTVTYSWKTYRVTTIDSKAFNGCSGVTRISIPSSVTSIGSQAFEGCTGLTKAEFASLESLCNISFGGESSNPLDYAHHLYVNGKEIISLTIPNSVTGIGQYAFEGCMYLSSVTMGSRVTAIGDYAFRGCSRLKNLEIGVGVTSIGQSAFYACSALTSVEIPSSVTSIGDLAFSECPNLTSIKCEYVSTNTGSIAKMFGGIRAQITEFVIGDGVTIIPDSLCFGMSELKSMTIPVNITSIGKCAFSECSKLTSIKWNARACASTGWNSKTEYFSGIRAQITDFIIGDEVSSIPDYLCLNMKNLKSIIIPASVTSIGMRSFNGSGLMSIEIPSSVTSMDNTAFLNTPWYDNQPDGLIYAGSVAYRYKGTMPSESSIILKDGTTSICKSLFSGCRGLKSIEIPSSVMNIGSNAFYNCAGLKSIIIASGNSVYDSRNNCNAIIETATNTLIAGCQNTVIPNGVVSIGESAFYGSGLTSIEIPNSVTSIAKGAFSGCSSLESITLPFVGEKPQSEPGDYQYPFGYIFGTSSYAGGIMTEQFDFININGKLYSRGHTYYCIPSSLQSVTITGNDVMTYAFSNCSNVKSIKISSSVTSIGDMTFYNCNGLTSIEVASDNSVYDSRNNCNAIIETASNTLIAGCQNTVIPSSVTSIGSSAFYECTGLTSIEIPSGVTSIGDNAFESCTGLTSIVIPSSVTIIDWYAFYGCTSLKSIEIPSSVTSIGGGAFAGCTSLTSIVCLAGVPPRCDNNAFYSVPKTTCSLYVPDASLSAYKTADGWKDFTNINGISTGIDQVEADETPSAKNYIDLTGRKVITQRRGQVYLQDGKKVMTR